MNSGHPNSKSDLDLLSRHPLMFTIDHQVYCDLLVFKNAQSGHESRSHRIQIKIGFVEQTSFDVYYRSPSILWFIGTLYLKMHNLVMNPGHTESKLKLDLLSRHPLMFTIDHQVYCDLLVFKNAQSGHESRSPRIQIKIRYVDQTAIYV